MADQEGGLRTDLLKAFGDQLDKIYVKLGELDSRLEQMEKRQVKIELSRDTRLTARALDELARSFERFRNAGTLDISVAAANITDFIGRIKNAFLDLSNIKIDRTLGGVLSNLTKTLDVFTNADTSKLDDNAQAVLTFFELLADTSTKTDPAAIFALGKTIKEVGIIFKEVEQVATNAKKIDSGKITVIINGVILPFMISLQDLVKTAETIKSGQLKALGDVVAVAGLMLTSVFEIMEKISKFSFLQRVGIGNLIKSTIIPFFTSITEIIRLSGNLSLQRLKALATIMLEIKSLFDIVADTFINIPKIDKNGIKGIADVFKSFGSIFDALEGMLATSRNVSPQRITLIKDIIRQLNVLLLDIQPFLKVLSGGFFSGIGTAVKRFQDIFKAFNPMFQEIGKIATLPNVDQSLSAIGTIFNALGNVVDIFVRLQGKFILPTNFIRQQLLFNRIIGVVANGIQKMLAQTAGFSSQAIKGVGEILSALPGVVDIFIGLQDKFKGLTNLARQFAIFDRTTKVIGKAVKSMLAGVDGVSPASIEGVGKILAELPEVFDIFVRLQNQFTKLTNLSRQFLLFERTIKVIGKALGHLSKIGGEIPSNIADTFVKILRELPEMINIFLSLQQQFTGLTSLVRQFVVFDRIVQVVAKAFKSIREAITGGEKNSIKDFTEAIKLILDIGTKPQGSLDFSFLKKVSEDLAGTKLQDKDVKNLSKLGKALKDFRNVNINVQGLGGLFEALSRADLKDFKNVSFGNLGRELTELSKSIKGLSTGELEVLAKSLNGSRANSIATGAKETAQNVDILGRRFEDLSDEITEGILSGNSAIRVTQTLITGLREGLIGAYRIYSAFGTLSIFRNALEGAAALGNAIKEIGDNVREAGENLRDFGDNVLQNFSVGNIFNSEAFQGAIEFDQIGTQVQVFGELTDEARAQAEAFANQIGVDYPLSANEALSATLDLIKAGQDLASIESILPSAADLAALSDSGDIGAATETLIQAQASFSEFSAGVPASFDNIAAASDIISNAANSSTASVEDLAAGIANVGPVASQFSLDFADVNSILAQFSNGGIEGAEAGTQLKTILTSLNSDRARAELDRLGVSMVDSQGNFRDFNDVIVDLDAAMNDPRLMNFRTTPGLSAEDQQRLELAQRTLATASRNQALWNDELASGSGDAERAAGRIEEYQRQVTAANGVIAEITGSQEEADYITREITRSQQENATSLKNLFGAYGQVGGSILLANGGFGEMRDTILSGTTAQERAAQLMDNLAGDLEQLSGSVETLLTKALLPLIDRFFRPFVKIARFVVDSFNALDISVLAFISTSVTLLSIGATLIGGLVIFAGAVLQVGGAVFTVIGVLINFGAVMAGIAAGVTAFVAG